MLYNDEIIILKEIKYKDYDKILHVYSRNKGKIQIISRGCRKSKSKLLSSSQIFSYSNCILYNSRDMYILNSADLITNFYKLRENLNSYFYGCYILELIDYIIQENDVDSRMFDMTIKTLKCLENKKEMNKIIGAYELKLASMIGYKPNLINCLKCGAELNNSAVFKISEGGFYCEKCKNELAFGRNMKYKEIKTMEKILKTKFENIADITNITNRILSVIREYLFYHIGKNNFASLKIIEKDEVNG